VIAATLLVLVACYFAARKVMASDIELGMDRIEVSKILGKPTEAISLYYQDSEADAWETVVFRRSIYMQAIIVDYDATGKAKLVVVINQVFGHSFEHIRQ
jgi:hypothetical protein